MKILSWLATLALAAQQPVFAETISFSGVLAFSHSQSQRPWGLESFFRIGDAFAGTFTFDASTPPTEVVPWPRVGGVESRFVGGALSVQIGEVRVLSPDSALTIVTGASNPPYDTFTIYAASPTHDLVTAGATEAAYSFGLTFRDSTRSILSNDGTLPSSGTAWSEFDDADFSLTFFRGHDPYDVHEFDAYSVGGPVFSASAVPEPSTLVLFGLGLACAGASRRCGRMARRGESARG